MTFEGEGCPPVIRNSRVKRAAKIVLPAGAALGAGAAIAAAAIPAADGTITACYNPGRNGGDVRFVNASGDCVPANGEVALTWNQQGKTGATGAPGPAGPAGPAGSGEGGAKTFPAAASQYLLDMDGIKGESHDNKHNSAITVDSFSWGETQSSSGGGGGAGKVKFHDISITKPVDTSSAQLFAACASGEHIKKAVLYVRKAGGTQVEYLRIALSDVRVSSFHVRSQEPAGVGETESVTLNFAKVSLQYTPVNGDGSAGPPVTAGWDVKSNKKI